MKDEERKKRNNPFHLQFINLGAAIDIIPKVC